MRHASLLLLLLILVPYLVWFSGRGWIPHDEGLLAQSAERILQGEWPHLDFDDPYTGGLALYHAALFKVLGVQLYSLRIGLLAFSLGAAVAIYAILQRVAAPWLAAALTAFAMAWSTPNYFAGLPSWYNLFFAIFCLLAGILFFESGKLRWLWIGGLMCGLSFLVKSTGLFSLCAAMLGVVFHEQLTADRSRGGEGSRRAVHWAFFLFTTSALIAFGTALTYFSRQRFTAMDFLHFVLPGWSCCGLLIWQEWHLGPSNGLERFRRLTTWIAILLAGFMTPIAIFLTPYLSGDGLLIWIEGVFVTPQKRISWSSMPLPEMKTLAWSLPVAVLFGTPMVFGKRWDRWWLALILLPLALSVVAFGNQESVYRHFWDSTRPLVPLLVLIGCCLLVRNQMLEATHARRSMLFASLCGTAMLSLIQFPYAFAIYFCYVAPLLIVYGSALSLLTQAAPRHLLAVCVIMYFGFAVAWLHRGHIRRLGAYYVPYENTATMTLPRFGLKTTPVQASLYEQVVGEVQKHSKLGDAIYATADCPEIYFLSARRNPMRSFYDFFERDFDGPPDLRVRRILRALEEARVNVVVLHWTPEFSGEPSENLVQALATHYPNVRHFFRGNADANSSPPTFSVAWREIEPAPAATTRPPEALISE